MSLHEPAPAAPGRPYSGAAGERVGELFAAHGRMVYGVCRLLLRDADEAEDAAQQTFLSAYQSLLGGTGPRDAAAWLATIARNECRNRISNRMRAPLPLADDLPTTARSVEDAADERARVLELRAALGDLPAKQREAIVLRDLFGLRYDEVATALGTSRFAVESLLFRGRRRLQTELRPRHAAAVLVVPLALRDSLAYAVPGFGAGSAGAGVSAAGVGLAAKLLAAPAAAKLAAVTVAAGLAGTAAVGVSEHGPKPAAASPVTPAIGADAGQPTGSSILSPSDALLERGARQAGGEDRDDDEADDDETEDELRDGDRDDDDREESEDGDRDDRDDEAAERADDDESDDHAVEDDSDDSSDEQGERDDSHESSEPSTLDRGDDDAVAASEGDEEDESSSEPGGDAESDD